MMLGAVGLGADAAVGVHPDGVDLAAAGLRRLQRALTGRAGDREDDVGALADQALGGLLAALDVLERLVAGYELAVLLGRVPAEHLDLGVLLRVVVLHALGEAVHEDRHGRDLQAAEGADLLGLRHPGGQVAGHEAGLRGVEDQRLQVLGRRVGLRVVVVHDRELDVGVLLGRGQGVVAEQEADGDDDVAVGVDHRLDVLGEVGGGLGLHLAGLDAQLGLGVGQALVGGLVERLVVEATRVGDHARLERLTAGRRARARARARGRRSGSRSAGAGGLGTTGQCQGGSAKHRCSGGQGPSHLLPPRHGSTIFAGPGVNGAAISAGGALRGCTVVPARGATRSNPRDC